VLEEQQRVVTRQIGENFLQGSSCLMVGQMTLQRTLLSDILFCTTKNGIMMGQLLLCNRLSCTRPEPWWCSSPLASSTSRSGGHTCNPVSFWYMCWRQRRHVDPDASHPLQSSFCLGQTLNVSPVPRALGLSSEEGSTTCPFQRLLYKG